MRNGSLCDIHLGEFSLRPDTQPKPTDWWIPIICLDWSLPPEKTQVFLRVTTPLAKHPGKPPGNHGTLVCFELVLLILFLGGLIYHCIHHVRTPRGCRISLQQGMYGKLRYPAASNVAGAPCRLQLLCDAELLADAEAEAWWLVGWRTWDLIYHPKTETKDDSGRWTKSYKGCLRLSNLSPLLNLEGDDVCFISKTEFNLQWHWVGTSSCCKGILSL